MLVYAATAAVLVALWTSASASPLFACDNDGINSFVADDRSLCVFYQCAFGRPVEVACAKGSRVPSYFSKGPSDPCIIKVKKNQLAVCDRCNVTDDIIPTPNKTNQCALFRPCDARPNCTCVDQVAGYYCSCPATPSVTAAPTPARTPVQQCQSNSCLNGGTCYSLYKNQFCNCKPPYTGKFCEANACDALECNNGECVFDAFGVYCLCEPCFTGQCCEDKIPNCSSNCSECVGGLNCSTPRKHLCKCNPCKNETDLCANAKVGKERTCQKPPDTAAFEFTLMFEDNFSDPPFGLEVYVSAASDDDQPRYVTVDAPLMSYTSTAVIQPGEVRKFIVDSSLKHTRTSKENFGIRVRETRRQFVNVYCINRATFSADGWLALPDKVAGKAFTVISYSPIISASQFAIVAIQNNTTVDIMLANGSEDIPNSGPNTVVRVNLNAWQTYQVKSARNDLTGTTIVSNNPIHVYSGEARGWVGPSPANPDYDPNFPANLKSRDNLILECTSVDTWGKTYALVPLSRAELGYPYTEEVVRIVSNSETQCTLYATTDKSLTFTSSLITIGNGQKYAQFYMNAAYNYFLTCDKPVMLVEITESSIPKYSLINDPSFIFVPSISSYSNNYHFVPPVYSVTNSPYIYTYLRLIASASEYLGIEINNEELSTLSLQAMKNWTRIYVPNAGSSADFPILYGCIVRISSSNSTAVNHPGTNAKFAAIVEGYDNRESYGIALGASIKPQNSSSIQDLLRSSGPIVATVA